MCLAIEPQTAEVMTTGHDCMVSAQLRWKKNQFSTIRFFKRDDSHKFYYAMQCIIIIVLFYYVIVIPTVPNL